MALPAHQPGQQANGHEATLQRVDVQQLRVRQVERVERDQRPAKQRRANAEQSPGEQANEADQQRRADRHDPPCLDQVSQKARRLANLTT